MSTVSRNILFCTQQIEALCEVGSPAEDTPTPSSELKYFGYQHSDARDSGAGLSHLPHVQIEITLN